MRKINLFLSTILLGFSLESFARDQIKIVGSSTVYPFATYSTSKNLRKIFINYFF